MPTWRDLRTHGFGPVERIVAVFQVGPPLERLPFPSFKVKVIERGDGSFLAVKNVATRGPDGYPDYEAGLGNTVEEALDDTLNRFARRINACGPLTEADFVWSDPVEF